MGGKKKILRKCPAQGPVGKLPSLHGMGEIKRAAADDLIPYTHFLGFHHSPTESDAACLHLKPY